MEIQAAEVELDRRYQLGEIDDPVDPAARSPRHRELLDDFEALLARQSDLLLKEDFSRIYTAEGASGMNAGTSYDFTIYFINVPANKLELWFWMESDRLANPVFREFYAERSVVYEERRLRTDSTPIGKFQEQFEAMFWQSSPYGWPVVGWPSDLEGITRDEALGFSTPTTPRTIWPRRSSATSTRTRRSRSRSGTSAGSRRAPARRFSRAPARCRSSPRSGWWPTPTRTRRWSSGITRCATGTWTSRPWSSWDNC